MPRRTSDSSDPTARLSDERVAELTRLRLAALGAELGVTPERVPALEMGSVGPLTDAHDPVDPPAGRHARRPVPVGERVGGWVGDRLPQTLNGRIGLARGPLVVLVLVVVLGVAVTGWTVTRAAGTVEAPQPVGGLGTVGDGALGATVPASPSTGAAPGSSASADTGESSTAVSSDQAMVVVDVAGRVRRPGIAVLPLGSRVVDALEAAGGARPGVDLTTVNLARLLVDGEQILVGRVPGAAGSTGAAGSSAAGPVASSDSASSLVNLNTADQAALESLPGVGPVTAAAILAWRQENGGFTSVEQLLDVSGIGEATLAEIAPHVTL